MDARQKPTPHYWRDRAEEYRVYAEEAKDMGARSSYLVVARSCDEIADRLARLATTHRHTAE